MALSRALGLSACSLLVPIEGNLTGGRGDDGLDIDAGPEQLRIRGLIDEVRLYRRALDAAAIAALATEPPAAAAGM